MAARLAGRAHSGFGGLAGAASDGSDQSTEGVKVDYEEDEREDQADVGHNRHSPESLEKQEQGSGQILRGRARVKRYLVQLILVISMFEGHRILCVHTVGALQALASVARLGVSTDTGIDLASAH